MKTQKKFLILIFTFTMLLSFVSCGQSAETPAAAAAPTATFASTATPVPTATPTPEPTQTPTIIPEPTPVLACPKEDTLAFLESYEDLRTQFSYIADRAANSPITTWDEKASDMQVIYNQFQELTLAPPECAEAYYVLSYEYMTLTMAVTLEVVNSSMATKEEWNPLQIASMRKDRAAKEAYDQLMALLND